MSQSEPSENFRELPERSARNLWALEVFDAWSTSTAQTYRVSPQPWGYQIVFGSPPLSVSADSADKVRLSAACSMLLQLPEVVRSKLGKCP